MIDLESPNLNTLSSLLLATPQPQSQPQDVAPAEVKPTQPLEIEQSEQPETIVESGLVAEISLEESVFGVGWSVTELLNEFSGRQ